MTRRHPRRVIGLLAAGIAVELLIGLVGIALVATGHRAVGGRVAGAATAAGTTGRGQAATQRRAQLGAPGAARLRAVRALLARRAQAVLGRDRAAFLADVDPSSSHFRATQARLFDDLADVPLASWSYTVDDGSAGTRTAKARIQQATHSWSPQVTLSFRLTGFDTHPVTEPLRPTFVERAGRWFLTAPALQSPAGARSRPARSGTGPANPWDFGPVRTLRSGDVLVLGHPGSASMMREIAAAVRAAIPRVTAVWGPAWPQRVVVLLPESQRELAALVDDGSDLSQIAAVATAELPKHGAPTGERVVVNPRNFAQLGALGRRVVLTHEITHIAARAVTSPSTPEWLAEGFADYVGYRGTGVATPFAAEELAADLRNGGSLVHLPTPADFAGTNPRPAEAYEESWLACRLLAHELGPAGLVSFYRAVSAHGGPPKAALDAVLHETLGRSSAQFTASWRRYVVGQLR